MNTLRFGLRPFFPELFNDSFEQTTKNVTNCYKPATNIRETDKEFKIDIALPGFTKEEINIDFEHDVLIIKASHEEKDNELSEKYSWNEFAYKMNFERTFQLPENINPEAIEAKFENGVLAILLPKKEVKALKTKQIAIA